MHLDEYNMNCTDLADDVINEMRKHVGRLHDRLGETEEVLHRSHAVNEKIMVMKEYKDEAGTFNSCFRGKDRDGLVRSLQHENRQILNLQEENRQLKLALEEMKHGMGLIMEKHRKVVLDNNRAMEMMKVVQKSYESSLPESSYAHRFFELADFTDKTIQKLEAHQNKDFQKMSELCAENKYLRTVLAARGALVPGINADSDGKPVDYIAKEDISLKRPARSIHKNRPKPSTTEIRSSPDEDESNSTSSTEIHFNFNDMSLLYD